MRKYTLLNVLLVLVLLLAACGGGGAEPAPAPAAQEAAPAAQEAAPAAEAPAAPGQYSEAPMLAEMVAAGDLPNFRQLKLNMRIDDGFVAYLNGTKVTSLLEPANLAWDSNTMNGGTHAATLTSYEEFDITPHLGHLQAGPNVLALHGLNSTDGSSDLLVMPQLVASDVPPPPPTYNEGMLVQHDAYGVGKIMSVSGHGALKKVKIRFAKGGERTFIAEKAKLTIISKR